MLLRLPLVLTFLAGPLAATPFSDARAGFKRAEIDGFGWTSLWPERP